MTDTIADTRREIRFLLQLIRATSEPQTFDDMLQVTLELVCAYTGWDYGAAWTPKIDQNVLELTTSTINLDDPQLIKFKEQSKNYNFPPQRGLIGRVWHTQKSEWISEIKADNASHYMRTQEAKDANLKLAVAFPVSSEQGLLAVLEFFCRSARVPDPLLIELLEGVTEQLAVALERRRVEDALRESEERLAGILNMAAEAVITVNDRHEIIRFNRGSEEIFGYQSDEILGKKLDELVPDRSKKAHNQHVKDFATGPDVARYMGTRSEVFGKRKDGTEFPAEASISRVKQGDTTIYTAILRDITERTQREDELLLLKRLLDTTQDGVGLLDINSFFRYVNHALADMTGYSEQELIGMSIGAIFDVSSIELDEVFQASAATGYWQGEVHFLRRDGSMFIAQVSGFAIRDDEGQVSGLGGVVRDITVQKQTEQAIARDRNILRTLLDGLPDAVYIKDEQARYITCNTRQAFLSGAASWEELVGKTTKDIFPQRGQTFYDDDMQVLNTGQPVQNKEESVGERIGVETWHLTTKRPIYDQDGKIIGLVGIGRDMTERVQFQKQLAKSEERYRQLLQHLPDTTVCLFDNQLRYTLVDGASLPFVSKQLTEGQLAEDVTSNNIADIIVPQYYEALHNREVQFELTHDANTYDVHVIPVRSLNSGSTQGMAVYHNITHLKQVEQAEHEQRILAEALRDTAVELSSSLDLERVFELIFENVGRVVPHDAANLVICENDTFSPIYWQGYPEAADEWFKTKRWASDHPSVKQVINADNGILTDDIRVEFGAIPGFGDFKGQMTMPMRARGQVIGIINLNSTERGFYQAQHRQPLGAFASQAAIAIQNAQFYDEIRRNAEHLELRVHQRTQELNAAKEQVEIILNSVSDTILLTDIQGTIQQGNTSFTRLFGYSIQEAHGQSLSKLTAESSLDKLEQALSAVTERHETNRLEVVMQNGKGTQFDADIRLNPTVADGSPAIVCTIRDISQQKQIEDELRKALEQERYLHDLKTRFISMVSHEYRTPLTIIQSSTGLIERYSDRMQPEERDKHFDSIYTQIKHMTALMEDVLAIGESEFLEMQFERENTDIGELCLDIVREFRLLTKGSQQLLFNQADTGPCEYMVSSKLLRQVVTNLISNAIKYSPAGGEIELSLRCDDQKIIFKIRDEGIGIPEEDQQRLFEMFHRATNAELLPGTGLGLAIVKRAVELHQGYVRFESQENIGTTFTVEIPVQLG